MLASTKTRTQAALSHRIQTILISGGFLDGARFDLADGLNCLIGARGTGKTTVLELIRFVFDVQPAVVAEQRRLEALVQNNLGGGHVQVQVETKDGVKYQIQRSAGEEPLVLNSANKPTDIKLKAGGVFTVDVYSQNEVEKLADEPLAQLALIDNFAAEDMGTLQTDLNRVRQLLRSNASQLVPLQEKLDLLEEEIKGLPGIEAQLQEFAGDGKGGACAVDQAHAQKALRDREKQAVQALARFLGEYEEGVAALQGQLVEHGQSLFEEDMLAGANAEQVQAICERLRERGRRLDRLVQEMRAEIVQESRQVAEAAAQLQRQHDQQELAFRGLIEKHRTAQKQATERTRLEKARNELLGRKREYLELAKKRDKLQSARTELLQQYSELQDRRFAVRRRVVEKINGELEPNVRVSVVQHGQRQDFQEHLEEALKRSGLKLAKITEKLSGLGPLELAKMVSDKDPEALVLRAGIRTEQAEKVIACLGSGAQLLELETVALQDLPRIELKCGEEYRELSILSTGQKCTALLPILLLDSSRPLLVDQPEDNLDNSFIYETVVESIRQVKARRQLVFATHSANLLVLGDAEKVFVLTSDGSCAHLTNEGNVEECKQEIGVLLEGGKQAFRLRRQRYGW